MAEFFADAGAVRGEPDLVNTAGTVFGERAEAAEAAGAPIAPPEPPIGDASKKRGGFLAPLRIANFRWLVARAFVATGRTVLRASPTFPQSAGKYPDRNGGPATSALQVSIRPDGGAP